MISSKPELARVMKCTQIQIHSIIDSSVGLRLQVLYLYIRLRLNCSERHQSHFWCRDTNTMVPSHHRYNHHHHHYHHLCWMILLIYNSHFISDDLQMVEACYQRNPLSNSSPFPREFLSAMYFTHESSLYIPQTQIDSSLLFIIYLQANSLTGNLLLSR